MPDYTVRETPEGELEIRFHDTVVAVMTNEQAEGLVDSLYSHLQSKRTFQAEHEAWMEERKLKPMLIACSCGVTFMAPWSPEKDGFFGVCQQCGVSFHHA